MVDHRAIVGEPLVLLEPLLLGKRALSLRIQMLVSVSPVVYPRGLIVSLNRFSEVLPPLIWIRSRDCLMRRDPLLGRYELSVGGIRHEGAHLLLDEVVLPSATLRDEVGIVRDGGAVLEGPIDRHASHRVRRGAV